MVTGGIRLRLEALPTHMESTFAPFARLCEVTGTSVEGIADRFALGRHLVAIWRQCLGRRRERFVEFLSHFSVSLPLSFGFWGRGVRTAVFGGSPYHGDQAKLHFRMVGTGIKVSFHWLGSIWLLCKGTSGLLCKFPEQHLVGLSELVHRHRHSIWSWLLLQNFKDSFMPSFHDCVPT